MMYQNNAINRNIVKGKLGWQHARNLGCWIGRMEFTSDVLDFRGPDPRFAGMVLTRQTNQLALES